MKRILLVRWKAGEAGDRRDFLEAAGFEVRHLQPDGMESLCALRDNPPDAIVIDLGRLPSHGRDVALAIRQQKGTRHVPLIFAGGEPGKVAQIRSILPDAVYAPWSRIAGALRSAIANPPADPVRPSLLAGYSGTPLPKKLGIKPDSVVWLASAPPDFAATLGELPQGAVLRHDSRGRSNLIVWFTRSRAELERSLARMAAKAGQGPIWIAWPKKTSGVASDLSEQCVRDAGLAHGLVDYKVCAIDPTWSGLLFTKRKTPAK